MISAGLRLTDALSSVDAAAPADDATAIAVTDAALRQFELFGLARTTMEDIARRAKVSRVTVYRRFASKDALIEAVLIRELQRFLADLDRAIEPLEDPESRMVEGFVFTLEAARSHRLLQRLLESEPEMLLPHLTVQGAPFIGAARDFLAARTARELDDGRDEQELLTVAEVVVRLILSFLLTPQASVDLDDPDAARAFARRYMGPIFTGGDE